MDETKTLLGTILSLQPRTVVEGAKSREVMVLELIAALLEQIPAPLDLHAIARSHETDRSPLTIVLLQEIERYNTLLSVVVRSLRDLQKGIKGLVVISPELELMLEALHTATVPLAWHSAYPSMKPLGPWTRDLGQRISQLSKWASEDAPKVFWLSGFTFPVGFLTALLQMSARRNGLPIEALTWDFVVMGSVASEQALNTRPKEGAYIKGLFLEGARWDLENACLAEPFPMELLTPMPIIHFKPVVSAQQRDRLHTTTLRAASCHPTRRFLTCFVSASAPPLHVCVVCAGASQEEQQGSPLVSDLLVPGSQRHSSAALVPVRSRSQVRTERLAVLDQERSRAAAVRCDVNRTHNTTDTRRNQALYFPRSLDQPHTWQSILQFSFSLTIACTLLRRFWTTNNRHAVEEGAAAIGVPLQGIRSCNASAASAAEGDQRSRCSSSDRRRDECRTIVR